MYPKVKVPDQGRDEGEEEEEAAYYKRRDSSLNPNDLQSRFSVDQEDENSRIFVTKTPKIYISSVMTPPMCMSEETGKHRRAVHGEIKPSTKASPILRPRAVVSSPDNDAMIGNINRNKERKGTKALQSHDQILNIHSQCKHIHRKGHTDTKKTKDASTRVKISHTTRKEPTTVKLSSERGNSGGSKTKVGKRTISP